MAYGSIKTEMGMNNGKGRWMYRADAKRISRRKRRREAKEAVREDG